MMELRLMSRLINALRWKGPEARAKRKTPNAKRGCLAADGMVHAWAWQLLYERSMLSVEHGALSIEGKSA